MSTISSLSSQYSYSTQLYSYGRQNQKSDSSVVNELMRQTEGPQESQRDQSRRQESYGLNFDPSMMQAMMNGGQQTGATQDQSDMISAMDTDSDGTITKDEFIAARPDDVSESMAENLWDSFDTEGVGSLSTSDLQTAMASDPPPGGSGGPGGSSQSAFQSLLDQLGSSSTTTDSTASTDSTSSSQNAALQALLEAIKAYDSTAGYEATKNVLSSVLSLA